MKSKTMILIGLVIAVLGAAALVYQGITYTQRETIVDVGSVNITAQTKKKIPLPPILGGIALAGGVGMIAIGLTADRERHQHD